MSHSPVVDIDLDHDSADPLNPTINYTHFHPSWEQRDPHVPLGFKIYGIGCLALFIVLLLLVLAYIAHRQINRFCKHGRGDEKSLAKSLPSDSLESATSSIPVEGHLVKYHTKIAPPPAVGATSPFIRRRSKNRDMDHWAPASTLKTEPPCVPPSIDLARSVARLASPVSPKTGPKMLNPIFPTEPLRAMTIGHARLHKSPCTSSHKLGNPVCNRERESLPLTDSLPAGFVGQCRDPVSPPKGILKTSPTYVARGSSTSCLPPFNGFATERSSPSTGTTRDTVNQPIDHSSLVLDRAHRNPFIKPSRPSNFTVEELLPCSDGTQSAVKDTGRLGDPSIVGREHMIITPPPVAMPFNIEAKEFSPEMSSACSQQTQIIHLGPEPIQASYGSGNLPVRRVSISIPSKNSVGFTSRTKGLASPESLCSLAKGVN